MSQLLFSFSQNVQKSFYSKILKSSYLLNPRNMEVKSEHTEILADITSSCRLCLKSDANVRNIFDNNHRNWANTDISASIQRATNLQVNTFSSSHFASTFHFFIILIFPVLKQSQ